MNAVLEGAVEVPPDSAGETARYGAGIIEGKDASIGHRGIWEAFFTGFWVSPDRTTAIAFSCNKDTDTNAMLTALSSIWSPS